MLDIRNGLFVVTRDGRWKGWIVDVDLVECVVSIRLVDGGTKRYIQFTDLIKA